MKKYSLAKTACLSWIILIPGVLLAQGGPGGPAPRGLSKDQLASMKERAAQEHPEAAEGFAKVLENFEQADLNKDALLSPEEFKTYAEANGIAMPRPPAGGGHGPNMTKEQFMELRDHVEEVEGQAPEAFNQIIANFETVDADQDGSLSPEEVRTYADQNGIEMPPPPPPPHGGERR